MIQKQKKIWTVNNYTNNEFSKVILALHNSMEIENDDTILIFTSFS